MTEIRTREDLERAHAALVGLAESNIHLYMGACRPACGMRRRDAPEVRDTVWLLVGAEIVPLLETLIGVDLHVQWGEVEFDGAPIEVKGGRHVNFSVVPNGRTCGACGCPELEHGMGPDGCGHLDWYCRACLEGGGAAAWHRPEIAEPERGEPL